MKNAISFTGINNLRIDKGTKSVFGPYIDNNDKLQNGTKNFTVTKIKCNLTDDINGCDYSEIRNALNYFSSKSRCEY
ncbi:MAG: hypothetical protein NC191_01310 [Muribaculaceae bacterium]|nr:hypothetical protein [Muribaculaceae bacterium]